MTTTTQWIAWRRGSMGSWSLGHLPANAEKTLCGEEIPDNATAAPEVFTTCSQCYDINLGVTIGVPNIQRRLAHTPGPWQVKRLKANSVQVVAEYHICQMLYTGYPAAVDANANLIAAAPDLLEACAALLKFNEELCQGVGVSTHYPSTEKARNALAKARGESK